MTPRPYYEDEQVTLYLGDCLDVLPHLPVADLVVTSPPYNLAVSPGGGQFGHWKDGAIRGGAGKWGVSATGIGYDEHDDGMPYPQYREWQRTVLMACWERLSDRGAIFYNHKPRVQADTLWTPLDLNPGLPLRQIVTWARPGGVNYTPVAYCPTSEWILVYAKPAFRLRDRSASGVGDVWKLTPDADNPHPAPFPVALPSRAIETTRPSLVIDPFSGSGTTLLAARLHSVRAIGIEKSERYCEMTADRLAQGVLPFVS